MTTMKSTKRFFRLLDLDRKEIGYIYLYAIFAGIITLSLPLGIQAIINLLVGGEVSSSLFLLIGIITLGIALNGFLTIMQLTVTETLRRRIFTRSSFEFAFRIPRLKMENLTRIYPPELINRFFDTLTIQKGIPKILIDFSTAVLQIFFGLILLSLYHPFFVFFGLILVLILISIFRLTGKRGLKTSLEESTFKYRVAHWLEELGRAMHIFKIADVNNLPIKRTEHLVGGYLEARKNHFSILLLQYSSVVAFKTIVTAALLLLGSVLVIRNQISIGQFVAAEIVVILIMNSVEKLIIGMDNIYDVLTALEKIGFVTDLPLDRKEGVQLILNKDKNNLTVELDNVYFEYPDAFQPAIRNVSLTIEPGESVCIAGYNNSGKSTLLNLLGGLYEDYQGTITYNGLPLRNLKLEDFRRHVGILSFHDEIFNDTILENILLGNTHVPMDEVVEACKMIGLHEFVNKLPEGYATVLVGNGENVPNSVISKIILARALVLKPPLLLLDHFMTRTGHRQGLDIVRHLLSDKFDWNVVIISNKKEIAELCDKVIVMKDGQIIVEGEYKKIHAHPDVRYLMETENDLISL